jgi:hypothetical protein
MTTITINGDRVEIPAPPLMSNDQLCVLLTHAAVAGDLYTCAVCEIAIQGHPRITTCERLDTAQREQLHREYLAPDGRSWYRERAQFELLRQSQAGAT